jgi:hypothetical protein
MQRRGSRPRYFAPSEADAQLFAQAFARKPADPLADRLLRMRDRRSASHAPSPPIRGAPNDAMPAPKPRWGRALRRRVTPLGERVADCPAHVVRRGYPWQNPDRVHAVAELPSSDGTGNGRRGDQKADVRVRRRCVRVEDRPQPLGALW